MLLNKVYLLKLELNYNFSNLDNFVFNLSGNAIDTALKIYGQEDLWKIERSNIRMNPKNMND